MTETNIPSLGKIATRMEKHLGAMARLERSLDGFQAGVEQVIEDNDELDGSMIALALGNLKYTVETVRRRFEADAEHLRKHGAAATAPEKPDTWPQPCPVRVSPITQDVRLCDKPAYGGGEFRGVPMTVVCPEHGGSAAPETEPKTGKCYHVIRGATSILDHMCYATAYGKVHDRWFCSEHGGPAAPADVNVELLDALRDGIRMIGRREGNTYCGPTDTESMTKRIWEVIVGRADRLAAQRSAEAASVATTEDEAARQAAEGDG